MIIDEKNYQVLNPGVTPTASVTITFENVRDAAWFEGCLLRLKRCGQLDSLHRGLIPAPLLRRIREGVEGEL